ncbi:MAG: hypothetical protein HLUCCA05_11685 [Roseibaca calidilacus]|uniref:Capsule biosynthesis protein n=1 Tax=Roseibaca calidilacus TaxID=1666912 RepID=A0A0P7WAB0_9RHOB|nr:DUF6356 family protein [Roseibaca calidilacus]KPP94474.1 MAG: hypothetical protein HLUCCA05_11685 [Roseibaca calidilacus]CUX83092.1 hypothetical protein Ga0058931_2770 [Roseibaca calidilacus]
MSAIDPQSRAKSLFAKVFLDHPASVDESYFQHMRFAFGFAALLAVAAGAALVHAVIPALCKTTASTILRRLHARLSHRHAQ